MSKLARAIAAQLRWMLASFAVCVFVLAGVSVWGLSLSAAASQSMYHDTVRTLEAMSSISEGVHESYEEAVAVMATSDPVERRERAGHLFNTTIPSVDVKVDTLQHLTSIDTQNEQVAVVRLSGEWSRFRNVVVPAVAVASTGDRALRVSLEVQFAPIDGTIAELFAAENLDGKVDAAEAHEAWSRSILLILVAAAAALLAATMGVVRSGRRFVGGAVAGESAQQEFAQTMQLADSEDDAYRVMTRYLDRIIERGRAIILNRNNSADRLEAMTELPPDWPLAQHLEGAHPRSCAAIRTARTYRRDPKAAPLLTCDVCAECPRKTLCTPITVGGEIIGSVLVERSATFDEDDEARVVQTVAQGAPVLANLRNLAVAELRAATDALTGLPNKRAVSHTLKRMVAQASRTVSPLAALSLDLDHFKEINDEHGHPYGDEVLAAVGAVLSATIRDADFAGRNGGEEFLLLLPATDRDGAERIAQKVLSAIREIFIRGVDRRITASIGIAVLPDDAGDAENLERAADRALYTAKSNGRDRIETAPRTTVTSPAT